MNFATARKPSLQDRLNRDANSARETSCQCTWSDSRTTESKNAFPKSSAKPSFVFNSVEETRVSE